ncbi:Armadillo-like helical [Cynara cardunculus var. scolymus]|uniref:Armadillo-like helical n=1 Tax=Cynara cardunculus var. scolymus TaxID=59895 RepID=A0A103XFA3_CYNCS|nr:Armadillo-like helical [Cynara cardunculus var. scolymus]
MESTSRVAQLLDSTLSPDGEVRRSATEALDCLSLNPDFSFALISIAVVISMKNWDWELNLIKITGGENHGQSIAAATYLKNLTRRNTIDGGAASRASKEFRDVLVRALLQAEPAILKVLIEAFRPIVDAEFVKHNMWHELVPELRSVIQDSDLVNKSGNSRWKAINGLTVLQSVIRPFQEPVPSQLELIAQEILVPLITVFHQRVEDLCIQNIVEMDAEKSLLIMSKCIYYAVSINVLGDDTCVLLQVPTIKYQITVTKQVRSHMPSALVSLLPSLCRDLIRILHSLRFQDYGSFEDGYMLRLKTGKRSLLIFCALITRHRKFSDKLMPDIINSVVKLVNLKTDFSKLDTLAERIVSLAFDVISRLLETGPPVSFIAHYLFSDIYHTICNQGWRLVSPHFSSLLESAIFPAIVMNEKDITEWEEDSDEYIRKNLPSELVHTSIFTNGSNIFDSVAFVWQEEISGWREDLFTPRKSALNLLGVISISKGPPVVASVTSKRKKGEKNKQKGRSSMGELLVLPFLSKFPIPSDVNTPVTKTTNDYYGVLMAYGSLLDFLREQKPAYTTLLIRSGVLPLYNASCHPYLVASANWILGELVSCIPEIVKSLGHIHELFFLCSFQDMSSEIYSSLLKALAMQDMEDLSCYPVRVSAAGAIAQLVENDFFPPEWLPILQVVVGRIRDNGEETSIMFELLKTLVEAGGDIVASHIPHIISLLAEDILKHIPPSPEPWPQVVERGFAALSVMAQCWEESLPEEVVNDLTNDVVVSGRATIAKAFIDLLQEAWLRPAEVEGQVVELPPSCCIDDSSTLLTFIMSDVNGSDMLQKQKVSEVLLVWADLISNCHSWEEEEDSPIFNCIKEAACLHKRVSLMNFIVGSIPSPHSLPVRQHSIIEGICGFVSDAFLQYPSAIYRASSSVHILVHLSTYSTEEQHIMHAMTTTFCQSAFSCFRQKQSKPSPLWKPLLLAISSCYICYPDIVENALEKDQHEGFRVWALALFSISSSKFEHGPSTESEIKLTVMTLVKLMTRLLMGNQSSGLLWQCFAAVIEASVRLKEVQEEEEDVDENEDENTSDDESEDTDDEDSEDDVHEETEEEFLERCAQAAVELENGTGVEEAAEEDEEQEIELGELEEVDPLSILQSLIEKNHQILLQGPELPQELVTSFVNAFPETAIFFHR